ncbi:hypothetical protein EYF80_001971 [Liparis tanakae]|uniref:Uncharacterized protein n=1 Tax=Liparis tanakae TaxID=230148 RepID=A0A4Z2JCS4_9TELE|nr:hypothetical protein EYF80_001971 [Liparis tanakae]
MRHIPEESLRNCLAPPGPVRPASDTPALSRRDTRTPKMASCDRQLTAWASRDFRLFCTVFSSSSSSEHLLLVHGLDRVGR